MILKTFNQVINILLETSKSAKPLLFLSFLSVFAFITEILLLISIGLLLRSQDLVVNNQNFQIMENNLFLIVTIIICSILRILINYKVIKLTHFFGVKIIDGIAFNKFYKFDLLNNKTETTDNTFITILANHSFTFVSCLQNLFLGLIAVFSAFSILLFIYFERSYLSIYAITGIGLLFIIITLLTNKSLKVYSKEVALKRKNLVGAGKEGLQMSKELFVSHRQKFIINRINRDNIKLMDKLGNAAFLNVFPRYSIEALLFSIYGFLLFRNSINQETLLQLPILIVACLKIIPSFQSIYAAVATLKLLSDSINEIYIALILEKPNNEKSITYSDDFHNPFIKFNSKKYNLFIKQTENNFTIKPVFRAISGNINPKNSLCLYGPSGTGKTTFLQTLIYNTCLENYSRISKSLKKINIEYLTHVPNYFSGTILENIEQGENNLDLELIEDLLIELKLCSSKRKIRNFLESKIGDSSKLKLSGGEEQRLSLIKALSRKPDFLFADEFTSALDSSLELIAYEVAMKYSRNLIFISHSKKLIQLADHKLNFPLNLLS